MTDVFWILAPVLFLTALVYTSVGLGGGSSYVAVLFLFGIPLAKIPPIALFFNITAASIALYKFSKKGYFDPKLVLPFVIASVPATFLGARLSFEEKILTFIFAGVLFIMALILLLKKKEVKTRIFLDKKKVLLIAIPLGAVLGFLAGVMGIGGGIFLGPVLLLLGFASSKQAAGACSAFVLVNSVVGLTSHHLQGNVDFSVLLFLGLAVFIGAQVGSFLGTKRFSLLLLQRVFAILLLIVSLKLSMGILG
jgi:hypothetical protein